MTNQPATAAPKAKPEKTDIIAFCAYGWGVDREANDAIYNMLRYVPLGHLEDLHRKKKTFEVQLFECSEDWTVRDSGSVSATYVAEYGSAKLDPRLCLKAKDVWGDLSEAI